jgi:hypothetical protein
MIRKEYRYRFGTKNEKQQEEVLIKSSRIRSGQKRRI